MSTIKTIHEISLDVINFEKSHKVLESYLSDDSDQGLFTSINTGVKRLGVHEPDDAKYRATMIVDGNVLFGDINKDESESKVLAKINVEYSLEFEANNPLSEEEINAKSLDESLGNALTDIMEPYFREVMDQLLSRAKIHMPLLPYNIKEKTYEKEI